MTDDVPLADHAEPAAGPYVAPAAPERPHETGIVFVGPWHDRTGFAEHARRNIEALASTGTCVQARGFNTLQDAVDPQLEKRMWPWLLPQHKRTWCEVHMVDCNPATLGVIAIHARAAPEEVAHRNRRRIAFVVLERDRVTAREAELLNLLAETWTSCHANAEALRRSGVEHVRVIPLPFDPATDECFAIRQRRADGFDVQDVPRFYHIGKWEPRKAQDQLLRAFLLGVKPGRAKLRIKTSLFYQAIKDYPQPATLVPQLLAEPAIAARGWTREAFDRCVTFYLGAQPNKMIVDLHRWGDCYLSLSRGEGWDMPAFDAVLAGNRLVYTPSGGPQDFARTEGDCRLTSSAWTMPTHEMYGWGVDARCLDYDVAEAAHAISGTAHNIEARRRERNRWWPSDATRFESAAVGAEMLLGAREAVARGA